jgi:hypothetical protein
LNFLPLPHGQGAFLPTFFIVQLRYATDLSPEEYVRREIWKEIKLHTCPWHPQGGCGFCRHGTYFRKFPILIKIPRWYCPTQRATVSMLPDFLAARLPGTLDEVENAVDATEGTTIEEAAERLRPGIDLPGGLRWLRRRIEHVRVALTVVVGLLVLNCQPDLASFRKVLGTDRVLITLRKTVEQHLHALPPCLGFGHRSEGRWTKKIGLQQSMGPD